MLLLLLNYVVLRALWKIDVHLISTLVNKSPIVSPNQPYSECLFHEDSEYIGIWIYYGVWICSIAK